MTAVQNSTESLEQHGVKLTAVQNTTVLVGQRRVKWMDRTESLGQRGVATFVVYLTGIFYI